MKQRVVERVYSVWVCNKIGSAKANNASPFASADHIKGATITTE